MLSRRSRCAARYRTTVSRPAKTSASAALRLDNAMARAATLPLVAGEHGSHQILPVRQAGDGHAYQCSSTRAERHVGERLVNLFERVLRLSDTPAIQLARGPACWSAP